MSKQTKNDIMRYCQKDLLEGVPSHKPEVLKFISDYYAYNGQEFFENFSFDNWKLVACWLYTFENKTCLAVPVFGRHSWRFWDNLPFFIFIRAPKIFFFLRPWLAIFMIYSMLDVWRENKHGAVYIDTDGKIISFFVCESFEFHWTRSILDFIIKHNKWLRSWGNIFYIYFKEGEIFKTFRRTRGDI
jgi:hypothetical protein